MITVSGLKTFIDYSIFNFLSYSSDFILYTFGIRLIMIM